MAFELRLFGIPVRIHLLFFVTALFVWQGFRGSEIGIATLPISLVIVLQAVLMHELGHALVGRAYGLEPRIDLMLFMGQTSWATGRNLSPGKSILMSFAGPFVGLVMGGVALAFALGLPEGAIVMTDPEATPTLLEWTLRAFIFVNLIWAIYNLFPILPLDGGNILAAFFQIFSPEHGMRFARYVSLLVIAALMLLALALQAVFLAAFLAFFAFINVQALRAEKELRAAGVPVIRSAEDLLGLAYQALEKGDHETVSQAAVVLLRHAEATSAEAVEGARGPARAPSGDGAIQKNTETRDEALHLLAWGRLLAGRPGEAREALDRLSGERAPDPALEGSVQLALGRTDEAIERFEEALAAGPTEMVVKKWVEAIERAGAYRHAARVVAERDDLVGPRALARLQASALGAGDAEAAFLLGELAFPRAREPLTAFNAACALVRLGRLEDAFGWLEKAHEVGFRDVGLLDQEEDLEALRARPEWEALRARFEA